ncbi:MAG: hypothetical protein ACXVKQ_12865 [Acidimicrobiia bacterium]
MAKASKYNRARIRSRVRRPKRRGGSMMWTVTTAVVIVVGVVLVTLTVLDNKKATDVPPILNQDHWHAFLGVDSCGTWLPNAPAFEDRANEAGVRAGLHSHGDGLMHIHPFSSDESGAKATVGRFITYGGWELSDSSFKVWDSTQRANGDKCGTGADAKKGEVQWTVGQFGKPWTGKPRSGNPADYQPKNGDIVAVYFLPKGAKLPEPPDAEKALATIEDLNGAPVSGSATTAPGGSTATTPSTSAPATGSTTATSTP